MRAKDKRARKKQFKRKSFVNMGLSPIKIVITKTFCIVLARIAKHVYMLKQKQLQW